MNQADTFEALRRRGYNTGPADLAIDRARRDGGWNLSRHRVTWTRAGGYAITPRPWPDGAPRPADQELPATAPLAPWGPGADGPGTPLPPVAVILTSPEVPEDAPLGLLRQLTREAAEETGSPLPPGAVIRDPLRSFRAYDQGIEGDVETILRIIETVDRHLDDAGPQWAKDCPEANMARRVGKAQLEAAEAMEELSLLTGENPRKGRHPEAGPRMLAELGDTAAAALLGIQSQVKDTGVTWRIFLEALAKAMSRVPREPDGSDRS